MGEKGIFPFVFSKKDKKHGITAIGDFQVGFGAFIVDLRNFFENTTYCGKLA